MHLAGQDAALAVGERGRLWILREQADEGLCDMERAQVGRHDLTIARMASHHQVTQRVSFAGTLAVLRTSRKKPGISGSTHAISPFFTVWISLPPGLQHPAEVAEQSSPGGRVGIKQLQGPCKNRGNPLSGEQ